MICYEPEFFELRELIGPQVWADRGPRAWQLLDARLLITLDQLRKQFGPITVNTWHTGGGYSESGLRDMDTSTGARYSQHKYGRAADCKFSDASPAEVAEYVQKNVVRFPYLSCLEDPDYTPTWLHVDVRNTGASSEILVVRP